MKISSQAAGVAGEYFVAAELSRRGHVASISLRNARGIDIIATNQAAAHSVTIQCKTNRHGDKYWILNKECETVRAVNHFYIFVVLGDVHDRPIYHIVPSRVVAKCIRTSHQQYLKEPGRCGRQHADSSMRIFSDHNNTYLERWDLLGL